MSTPAAPLSLSADERHALERLTRSQRVPHQQVLQARVLLLAGDGVANVIIAEEVGVRPATVRAWRRRFAEDGLAGLGVIRKGRGRKPSISEEKIAQIVQLTTTTTPQGQRHWSCRTMAKEVASTSDPRQLRHPQGSRGAEMERWFRELTDKNIRRGIFTQITRACTSRETLAI